MLQHDAIGPAARARGRRADAAALRSGADLRLVGHLGLRDDPAGRRVYTGEIDARAPADRAPASVAAGEIAGSQRGPLGELDIDSRVVLLEADNLTTAQDGNA